SPGTNPVTRQRLAEFQQHPEFRACHSFRRRRKTRVRHCQSRRPPIRSPALIDRRIDPIPPPPIFLPPRKAPRFRGHSIGQDWLISDSLARSMRPTEPLRPVPRFFQFAISLLPPTRPLPPLVGIRTSRP